jgi:hypothetical protein
MSTVLNVTTRQQVGQVLGKLELKETRVQKQRDMGIKSVLKCMCKVVLSVESAGKGLWWCIKGWVCWGTGIKHYLCPPDSELCTGRR